MEWMKTQRTLLGKLSRIVVGTSEEPIHGDLVVGTVDEPVNADVVVGTVEEPVYDRVLVEDRPSEYGGPLYEWQLVGYNTVDVIEKQIIGYHTITTEGAKTSTETPSGDTSDWAIPQLPNPHYKGADFIPRYYAFGPGDPVPIFNKAGYFDGNVWVSEERAGGWDAEKLTYADPTDSNDPLLYHGDGSSKAVVSTITPSGGWVSDVLLRGLIQRQQAQRNETLDLELDSTLYSSNSIFGLVPGRRAPGMNGKLLINGALVAADIGMLSPKGTRLNYDPRGQDLITIRSTDRLTIRRRLWAPRSPLQ